MTRSQILVRLLGALAAAALCAAGVLVLAHAAVGTARGQRLDELILLAAQADQSPMTTVIFPVLNTVTVPVIVTALVIAAIIALIQQRTSMAVHIVVLVAGAAATSQILKRLLVQRVLLADNLQVTPNSFPSGHTTLAAAIAVALTLAVPRAVRGPVAIAGAAWTAIAGIGTIAGGWHRPSDVLGALLVVGAWSFLVLAADALGALRTAARSADADPLPSLRSPRGSRAPRVPAPWIAVLIAAAVAGTGIGLACLSLVPTPLSLTDAASGALAYTGTAYTLAGATSALVATVLLVHVPSRPRSPDLRRVR